LKKCCGVEFLNGLYELCSQTNEKYEKQAIEQLGEGNFSPI
jgi:hypothetical protein